MSETAANVVMCEECDKHAAEIVAEDGRKLCGGCRLKGLSLKDPQGDETDADA
jgi:hypothetical protein